MRSDVLETQYYLLMTPAVQKGSTLRCWKDDLRSPLLGWFVCQLLWQTVALIMPTSCGCVLAYQTMIITNFIIPSPGVHEDYFGVKRQIVPSVNSSRWLNDTCLFGAWMSAGVRRTVELHLASRSLSLKNTWIQQHGEGRKRLLTFPNLNSSSKFTIKPSLTPSRTISLLYLPDVPAFSNKDCNIFLSFSLETIKMSWPASAPLLYSLFCWSNLALDRSLSHISLQELIDLVGSMKPFSSLVDILHNFHASKCTLGLSVHAWSLL